MMLEYGVYALIISFGEHREPSPIESADAFLLVKGEGALDKHLRCRNVSCGWSWRLVLESGWSWLRVKRERFMVRGVWCCSSRNRKQALVSVNDLAFVLTLTMS